MLIDFNCNGYLILHSEILDMVIVYWCLTLKTTIVMFTWNRNWTVRIIKVGGTPITLSNKVKLLGVTLDNKLNCNSHIEKNTNKYIGILIGPTWSLSPKVCRWIYMYIM